MTLTEIKNNLTKEEVIELISQIGGTDYIDKGDYVQFRTICHHQDENEGHHKLYYYTNSHMFVCYSCCGTFNIYDLFKKRFELLNQDFNIYRDVVAKIGVNTEEVLENGFYTPYHSDFDEYERKVYINIPAIKSSLLSVFTKYYPIEWLNENITKEAMDLYNIKYSISENKIIIPHYNENGQLIGIRGRALNEEDIEIGKYMPVQIENHFYSHPLGYNLYGLNVSKTNINKYKQAIIFEGEKSVLLFQSYFPDKNISVAACGSSLHNYQIELLVKMGANQIIIAFDKEGDDWAAQSKYYNKLKAMCDKYKNFAKMGFLYDRKGLINYKDSPIDRGKEVFLEIYKNVIWT